MINDKFSAVSKQKTTDMTLFIVKQKWFMIFFILL